MYCQVHTAVKTRAQPKCPSFGDYVTMQYLYMHGNTTTQPWNTVICNSVDGSENIMLSEVSQIEKNQKPCDFTHMWDIKLKETN